MGGKVFKQVAAYCGKKIRSKDLTIQRTPKALPNSKTKVEEDITLRDANILGSEIQKYTEIREQAVDQAEHQECEENHDEREPLPNGTLHDEEEFDFDSVSEFIQDPETNEQTLPADSSTKAPLGSRFPEIFSYEGRDGELCSALALTNLSVARWNVIFRCEEKIGKHIDELNLIEQGRKRVDQFIEDITIRLQVKVLEDPTFDKSEELQIIEDAKKINCEFDERKEVVEWKFHKVKEEMLLSRNYLFAKLKDLFEENGLLEPMPEDSDIGSIASNPVHGKQEQELQQRTATSSEAAAYALEDARQAAVEGMHEKERRLQDLRHKLDNWADHYDAEHQAYCKCIDNGQMKPARTVFDNILLQEHQEATRDLIQAEDEFEDARRLVRKLGAGMNDSDQESEFPDYVDDGYRESMEAAIIEHVDRDRIEQWMEEDQDRSFHSTECDAWESRTVDLCDSVSVVAEGKERKRIDRWRSICDLIEVDFVGEPDASPFMK